MAVVYPNYCVVLHENLKDLLIAKTFVEFTSEGFNDKVVDLLRESKTTDQIYFVYLNGDFDYLLNAPMNRGIRFPFSSLPPEIKTAMFLIP